jgi:pimeloyl-ACP methyl ester carboxylesterase
MPTVRTPDGVDLSYTIDGTGDPVVLIHGLGSFVGDWQAQIDALSRGFQVIAIDLRGHGDSAKPPGPYSVPLFASDVAAVIRALRLGPAHVVGLSLGGAVAFQLAVDEPALVRSLAIVNSGPSFVMTSLRLRLAILLRLFVLKTFGLEALGKMIVRRLFPKPDQDALRRAFLKHYVRNDRRAYEASTRALVGWTVAERLGDIRCPVLVVSGDRDYTPVAAKKPYVAALPNARLVVIEDAGHACTIERPAEVNRLLREFFTAVPATAGS